MPKRQPVHAETEIARSALGPDAVQRLRSFVERIERLEEERKALASDIKDLYTEAKSAGFDPKVLKEVVQIRRKDRTEAQEAQTLRDLYLAALDG